MKSEFLKQKNQEYFDAWDKKIESTLMSMAAEMAMPLIIFVALNIFALAILIKLNVY
jgi:hypothetical protein